tara:strand:- start:2865 stop:3326 length:462 start_codon:yes stop_codon:yes gene_type:complete
MTDTNRSIAKSVALKGATHLMKDKFDMNADLSAQTEKVIAVSNKLYDWLCDGTIIAVDEVFETVDKTKTKAPAKQPTNEAGITSKVIPCPSCGGEIWDNRHKPKEGFPIMKCKSTAVECKGEGAKWPWSIFSQNEVDALIKATKENSSNYPPF